MDTKQHIQVLRSQLLKMARLSQRAVDYSIKGYELGRPEFCQDVRNTEQEFGQLHRGLEDRCRGLLVEELPLDSDFRFVWCALRICSALRTTHAAAIEIAEMTMRFLEEGGVPESLAVMTIGQVVNGLVRLCTIALFKEEAQHARIVLENQGVWRWIEWTACHGRNDIDQEIGANATFELAIAKSLSQIAKGADEIADAITVWLAKKDPNRINRNVYAFRELHMMREKETARLSVDSIDSCFCA
jgi:hypothetical protein